MPSKMIKLIVKNATKPMQEPVEFHVPSRQPQTGASFKNVHVLWAPQAMALVMQRLTMQYFEDEMV